METADLLWQHVTIQSSRPHLRTMTTARAKGTAVSTTGTYVKDLLAVASERLREADPDPQLGRRLG